MNLAWLTDIHLNFLELTQRQHFYQEIMEKQPDGILISGDIAEAPSVYAILIEMQEAIRQPIYFVLGNHDYYTGQIGSVRQKIIQLTTGVKHLHWLGHAGVIQLTAETVLVGQDGWADGRLGDYHHSSARLKDERMITDFFQQKCLSRDHLLSVMQKWADQDAKQLQQDLESAALRKAKRIIVITHVPPFKENCLYEGKISTDNYLPYFASKAMGDVLLQFAQKYPTIDATILCGHTHSKSDFQVLGNLRVKSGQAEYGCPEVQEMIEV